MGTPPAASGAVPAGPRNLPPEWYADSDRNLIPDFIEQQIGYNPKADDCPLDGACGHGADGSRFKAASNILLILDSSGSMAARLGGQPKINLAKQALSNFVVGMPKVAQLGFMVYGHRGNNLPAGKAESCAGVELLAPIGSIDRSNVPQMLARFEPRGWTPIADSLRAAKNAFAGKQGNRVILVSDGLETCGGDPVAVARELQSQGLSVRVDVVGFDIGSADAASLGQIAEAGGGQYFNARTYRELDEYLRRQRESIQQTQGAQLCELQTINTNASCESEMEIKAANAMNAQARSFGSAGNQKARIEAAAMRARMSALMSERRRQRLAPGQQRLGNLKGQLQKNNEQILDAYGQAKTK